jgi:hypothetical protein
MECTNALHKLIYNQHIPEHKRYYRTPPGEFEVSTFIHVVRREPTMNRKKMYVFTTLFVIAVLLGSAYDTGQVRAQPEIPSGINSTFTYQGQLSKNNSPFTGSCDFTFSLWNAASGGSQLGSEPKTGVSVAGGVFTVQLNETNQFGAGAFDGSQRWLEVSVKCPGDSSPTTLGRQELTAAPYASYALTAGNLTGVLPVANGGTGSSTQNFVDLTNSQTVAGTKTFTSPPNFTATSAQPFYVTSSFDVANLNADYLDGQHSTAFQKHYQNEIVVAKAGGDFTTITSALNSLPTSGSGAPSSTNPYLIFVAPGVYTEQVIMKDFVDIQGSGEEVTKITFSGLNPTYFNATLASASNAELRFLTVENTGNHGSAVGIFASSSKNLYITHVTINVSGASAGSNFGVYCQNSSIIYLNEVRINVHGDQIASNDSIGIYTTVNNDSVDLDQVTIYTDSPNTNNSYGVVLYGGRATIKSSYIQAYNGYYVDGIYARADSSGSIYVDVTMDRSSIQVGAGTSQNPLYLVGGNVTAKVAGSLLEYGTAFLGNGANLTCVYDYNGNYSALNSSCQ